ncbi:hypothetical protein LCGC14_2072210 [marine sediment metagenome]|uniref:Uncharacterized protein n=1 Tax=marine sediment metagenome TaxID=412755 RepID=A0A0F9F5D6_9ZZZZ
MGERQEEAGERPSMREPPRPMDPQTASSNADAGEYQAPCRKSRPSCLFTFLGEVPIRQEPRSTTLQAVGWTQRSAVHLWVSDAGYRRLYSHDLRASPDMANVALPCLSACRTGQI